MADAVPVRTTRPERLREIVAELPDVGPACTTSASRCRPHRAVPLGGLAQLLPRHGGGRVVRACGGYRVLPTGASSAGTSSGTRCAGFVEQPRPPTTSRCCPGGIGGAASRPCSPLHRALPGPQRQLDPGVPASSVNFRQGPVPAERRVGDVVRADPATGACAPSRARTSGAAHHTPAGTARSASTGSSGPTCSRRPPRQPELRTPGGCSSSCTGWRTGGCAGARHLRGMQRDRGVGVSDPEE